MQLEEKKREIVLTFDIYELQNLIHDVIMHEINGRPAPFVRTIESANVKLHITYDSKIEDYYTGHIDINAKYATKDGSTLRVQEMHIGWPGMTYIHVNGSAVFKEHEFRQLVTGQV